MAWKQGVEVLGDGRVRMGKSVDGAYLTRKQWDVLLDHIASDKLKLN